MLDLHWIEEHLAVGARFPMDACGLLVDAGVRAVVDVRGETCDDPVVLAKHGLELLHLPTQDMTGVSVDMLDRGVRWVEERIAASRPVLIHCEHGVGRSTLLATCVLVSRGARPLDALRHAKARRPVLSFSEAQQRRFLEWCRQHAAQDSVPALGEIQRIVWG